MQNNYEDEFEDYSKELDEEEEKKDVEDLEDIDIENADEDIVKQISSNNDNIDISNYTEEQQVMRIAREAAEFNKKYGKARNGLSRDQQIELMYIYRNGTEEESKEAADKLLRSITNYVIKIAMTKYATYYVNNPMDIINQGLEGVLISLQNFDPTKTSLSTWCGSHILHQINEFIACMVHNTSSYYNTSSRKIINFIKQREKTGLSWTVDDIIMETDVKSKDTINNCLKIININKNTISLDNEFTNDNTLKEANNYHKEKEWLPEASFSEKEQKQQIQKAIGEAGLTDDEKIVLLYTYGFIDDTPLSDSLIAKKTDIPIQNIRKLKSSSFIKVQRAIKKNPYFTKDRVVRKQPNFIDDYEYIRTEESLKNEIDMLVFDDDF